jgi:hypothetical protein
VKGGCRGENIFLSSKFNTCLLVRKWRKEKINVYGITNTTRMRIRVGVM